MNTQQHLIQEKAIEIWAEHNIYQAIEYVYTEAYAIGKSEVIEEAIRCVEKETPALWDKDKKPYTKSIEEDIKFHENRIQNKLADAIIARLKSELEK